MSHGKSERRLVKILVIYCLAASKEKRKRKCPKNSCEDYYNVFTSYLFDMSL